MISAVFLGMAAFLIIRISVKNWAGDVIGDWFGGIAGILTTPFLMEASFMIGGFLLIVWLNHRRRMKDGDDFVDPAEFEPGGKRSRPR